MRCQKSNRQNQPDRTGPNRIDRPVRKVAAATEADVQAEIAGAIVVDARAVIAATVVTTAAVIVVAVDGSTALPRLISTNS